MSNDNLGRFLLIMWIVFPMPLVLLGYGHIQGVFNTDYLINIQTVPVLSDVLAVLKPIPVIGILVTLMYTILFGIVNILILIVQFLLLYAQVMLLTFPDVNFYLSRFINVLQALSLIYIVTFVRKG